MAELEAASLPAVTLGKTFGMPNRDAGNCFIFKFEGGIVKGAALCQLRQRIKGFALMFPQAGSVSKG